MDSKVYAVSLPALAARVLAPSSGRNNDGEMIGAQQTIAGLKKAIELWLLKRATIHGTAIPPQLPDDLSFELFFLHLAFQ
jgi:hypothetical protein